MPLKRVKYFILVFLGLAPIILTACASGTGSSDPPVTPDTTIPSSLLVNVTIAEGLEASDGTNAVSVITLGF